MTVPPLASSEGLGWDALSVYRFRYPEGHTLALPPVRGCYISAHVDCPCLLSGRWNGMVRKSRSIPGDIIILGAEQLVEWDWCGEFDEVQMILDPARFETAVAEVSDRPFTLVEGISIRDPFVSALAQRILEELAHPQIGSRYFSAAMADTLVWHLLRQHSTLRRITTLERIDIPAHKVRRALDFMMSHVAEDLSIDDIAAVVSMSSFRFARGFKKATGQSPYQFLLGKRIELAQELLRSTDRRLADIARAVGFATQSQFTVAFRRRCRLTPGRYREIHKS
ncbi:MAG TPA: AraC family transcriptional regulator [Steroidobacteraceae bacterium]|nr:AraC family transcriptional regulator [Steroidobacteraceae bacterium]